MVNIYHEDLDFVNEGVKILIRKSKTDQSGEGAIKAIPYFSNHEYCPVIALKNFIEHKTSNERVFDISDKLVAIIIKKYVELAGLDPSRYAGHSLRSGFATTAAEFGAEERNIMAIFYHLNYQQKRRFFGQSNYLN